jgi:hypothetical protein
MRSFGKMWSFWFAPGRLVAFAVAASSGGVGVASDTSVGALTGDPSSGVLQLKVGDIDTRSLPNLLDTLAAVDANVPYVVQLDGPMSQDRSELLAAAGVQVGEYLPQNAFIVRMDDAAVANLTSLPFVVWAGDFQPAWKLSPELGLHQFQTVERAAIYDAGLVRATITLFPAAPATAVLAELNRAGATINSADQAGDQWLIDATLDYNSAVGLTDLAEVQFVEDAGEASFRNDSNRWIVQSNVSLQTPVWNNGIHGEGQIGGLIDGAMRESHCMFDDVVVPGPTHRKIVGYRGSMGSDSHGTHTAGTFAGDATPFNVYTTNDGMAFAAKLSFKNLSSITGSNLYSSLQEAHTDGARVHSNSWGDDGTRSYTSWCRQIDQFSWDFEDNVVAFAVSNGPQSTTPENATNCLAVGASQDTPNQASFCSGGTGPTQDGRRKPEVFAPGCNTTSANAGTTCGVTGMTGTSMASPAVAGAGLLVRQYFTDGFYPSGAATPADGFVPTGGLVRAVMMNSATDMTGIAGYPSNQEGWGRLLLDNALFFAGDARKLIVKDVRRADGMTTGQTAVYTINVLSNAQPLRITMSFTQPPAAVNAANPAINNLDLEVVEPGGDTYRGNTFTSGQSSSGGTADARNNTEMVIRTAPTPGVYTIRVIATAVNTGPSPYALAISGDVSEGCPDGDVNGDCHVDLADLTLLLGSFGACTGDPTFDAAADLDASGCVDLTDLTLLLSNFGA